jgi:hypothetical protein
MLLKADINTVTILGQKLWHSTINELIESEVYPDAGGKISKSLNKIFEVAKEHNLIEIKSPKNIIDEKTSKNISKQVEIEREYLLKKFPKSVEAPPNATHGQIIIDNQIYCHPEIWTIYANLLLAKKWNAQSLFSNPVQNYCKYKFGIAGGSNQTFVNAFSQIFSIKLPETLLFPQIVFKEIAEKGITPCSTCPDERDCELNYLDFTETKISKYLEMRDFDEIKQLRNVIAKIIYRVEKTKSENEYSDIIREFHKEQLSGEKKLKLIFPKISQWANIGMIVATPFHFVGAATNLPVISAPADAILGLSAVTTAAVEIQKNQYKWIAFNRGYKKDKTRIRLIAKDDI